MIIIPAVDIKDGQAVRLYQGRRDTTTLYDPDPAAAALRWLEAGARFLHVVDLDGAFDGASRNEPHLARIAELCAKASPAVPLQVGGGVRDAAKFRRLIELGASRVVVGTRALEDRAFLDELLARHPGKAVVGVDARDGRVAVRGWTQTTEKSAEDFLRSLSGSGAAGVVYTDISRDGAMAGANIEAMRRACGATDIPVIASGGVTSAEDVRALAVLPLFGAIVGKALYEGRLTLAEAEAAAQSANGQT